MTARPLGQRHARCSRFVFMSVTKLEGIHGREIEERRRSRLHVAGFLLALLLVVAAVASAALTIAQIVRR